MWAYSTSTILILTTIELRYIVIIYVVEVSLFVQLHLARVDVVAFKREDSQYVPLEG